MVQDRYHNFKELNRFEAPNIDYQILVKDRGSPVTILAPHGGRIEPGSSTIAALIAKKNFNYYSFKGIKPLDNRFLHITSHRFDEPGALALVAKSEIAVTVHACKGNQTRVYVGGLNSYLKEAVAVKFRKSGIPAKEHPKFPGKNKKNLCNRCKSHQGLQLEISRDLRDDPLNQKLIASLTRSVLKDLL